MSKLTKTSVNALPTPAAGQSFVWDGELRGFGVRVSGKGVKSFVIQYRNGEGRSRRTVLGRVGVLTVEEARSVARIKLGQVASGVDPAAERREVRKAPTIADICDWYLEEAGAGRLLGRMNRPIKASTLYMDRSRVERHIKPLIGTRKVSAVEISDISRMQADIAAGNTTRARRSGAGRYSAGGPGAASRSISTLHSILAHAKREGLIKANPAAGIRRLASGTRQRRLSVEEILRFGEAMRELHRLGEPRRGLDLVRLIALTGFRINEAQGLQHHWFEREQRAILFPDTKSGPQRRAIGLVVEEILLRQAIEKGNPHVFPADRSSSYYKQAADVILRICKMAQLENVTAHTLRHTFSSVEGDLGYSELVIAAMLGHGKRGVTQGYIHIDDGLRLAVECTSSQIEALLDGTSAGIAPLKSIPLTREEIARALQLRNSTQMESA